MGTTTVDSFERPASLADRRDPRVLYARSYLRTRAIVGTLGILLPLSLLVVEVFLEGSVLARGSLSAYYHTAARDVFVGTLAVVGVLLVTYLSGQPDTWDFRLSLVAGIAALVVVLFPTARPGIPATAPRCGTEPMPDGCVAIQQVLGESFVAAVHYTAAGVFVLSLAAICFLFARREVTYTGRRGMARFLRGCGWAIIAAVVGIVIGTALDVRLGPFTALYLGEVVAVWAFGAAWLVKSRDLWERLGGWPRPAPPE